MSLHLKSPLFNQLLLLIIGILSVSVFIIDIYTPVGVSGGVIYMLFVLATYWVKEKKITRLAGIAASLLIVFGFVFSVSSQYMLLSAINHIMAIIVIWISVWFVNNYKASILQVRRNYQMLFQVANDEILVFALDENNQPLPFFEVNDTACNILGYSQDELLNKNLYEITAADKNEVDRYLSDALKYGETVFESRHISKGGKKIPIELSIRSFNYNKQQTIISVGRDLRERRRLEQEILNVGEQERQRIGRDIHDDLGQLLTVATISAKMLGKEMMDKNLEEANQVQEIAEMIKAAGERSRTISHGLVPVNIENNGLDGALQELADTVTKMYNVDVRYEGSKTLAWKKNSTTVHLYRIAQEAVNNAVKHGNATLIEVGLHEEKNRVILYVKDNGEGFQPHKSEGIGLRVMNFRASMIGGELKINSDPKKGTEIICTIPQSNL